MTIKKIKRWREEYDFHKSVSIPFVHCSIPMHIEDMISGEQISRLLHLVHICLDESEFIVGYFNPVISSRAKPVWQIISLYDGDPGEGKDWSEIIKHRGGGKAPYRLECPIWKLRFDSLKEVRDYLLVQFI